MADDAEKAAAKAAETLAKKAEQDGRALVSKAEKAAASAAQKAKEQKEQTDAAAAKYAAADAKQAIF